MSKQEKKPVEQILWTKAQCAEALAVSEMTVDRMRSNPDIDFPKPVSFRGMGGQLKWFKSEVLDWIYSHKRVA